MDLSGHWEFIKDVASQRLSHNKTKRHVEKYGTALEVRGAAAEVAARLYFGLDPHDIHTHFDNGVDLEYAGYTIDVKSTKLVRTMEFRALQWAIDRKVVPDVVLFVGIQMSQKVAAMLGYAWKWEVKRAAVNFQRNQPCYEIPVPMLHPAWELIARQSYMDWNKGGMKDEQKNPI